MAVSVALVGAIVWFVFRQLANFSDVMTVLRTLTWREMAVLALLAVWNLLTYWFVCVVATPGLTLPQAAVLTQSTTAVSNTVPAGGAVAVGLTYTMLGSWGFSGSRTTLFVVVTGIWNNLVKLGMPIFALAILALQGQPGGGRMIAAVGGLGGLIGAILVFALILRSEEFARRAGIVAGRWASALLRLVRRRPVSGWDLAVIKWRGRVIGLVRHRWLALTATTLLSHLSLYAVLLVCLRVMDVPAADVGWAEILAIFAFARLVTAIPLTPGGVGVVELALIAGLTAAGGNAANVVAAVLLFRLLTYVLPIAVGGGTYIVWRRKRSWRHSAPPLADSAVVIESSDDDQQPAPASTDTAATGRMAESVAGSATGASPLQRPATVYHRRWLDGVWLVAGLAVFALTAALADWGLAGWEEGLFTAANGLPEGLRWVIWPFMQYGVFLTIPVLTAIALLLRRFRLATAMAVAGVGVYFLAKAVKEFVQRGRPAALIEDVVERETFASGSLGYPSGHAAVAGALTVVVTPYLRGWWKVVPAALLMIVCFGRMYVAAHVPLDLIGGAALGVAAGGLAALIVGVPVTRPAAAAAPGTPATASPARPKA